MGQILIADEWYREPAFDGGSRALADLIRTLRDLGHEIDLAVSREAVEAMVDDGRHWQAAFLSRPELTLRCLDLVLDRADSVVYVGHDLHHLRLGAEADHGLVSPTLARAYLAMERECWRRCGVSIYPSQEEVNVVAQVVGGERTRLFPYFRVDGTMTPHSRSAEASFVMLGGAEHSPNVTGLRWFIEEVAPQLETQTPIDVIGWWPVDRRPPSGCADLKYVGVVPGEELTRRLANARGMLVPLRIGAGVKSKVIDSLATATPLITTSIGMQGITADEPVAFVSDDPDDWASLMRLGATEHSEVDRRTAAGVRYVTAAHGEIPYRRALVQLLSAY